MKDKIKKRKIDKEKIKKILVKVWFIISTILSVLFLITLIISGCQSKTKQNNTNSNSTNEIRSNRISRRIEENEITSGYYGFVDSDLRTYLQMSNGNHQTNCRIKAVNNNYYSNINLTYTYTSGRYEIALNYGALNVLNAVKTNGSISSMTWVNDYYRFIYIESIEDSTNPLDLNWILKEVNDVDNIRLDNGFNPTNYMTTSTRELGFFSSTQTITTINSNYSVIFKGLFVCNGVYYNQIKLYCVSLEGSRYLDSQNNIATWTTSGWYYVMSVSYINTISNENRSVLTINNGVDNNNIYLLPNNYAWVSDNYRDLMVIDYSNDNLPLLISSNSLSYDNIRLSYETSTTISTFIDSNVFTFLGGAFSSMLPILNVSILPGLTIGVLVILPLVVTIIVLIFRAVKK